jgi:hypothetical protein
MFTQNLSSGSGLDKKWNDKIVTVINGMDIIPRASLANMFCLLMQVRESAVFCTERHLNITVQIIINPFIGDFQIGSCVLTKIAISCFTTTRCSARVNNYKCDVFYMK